MKKYDVRFCSCGRVHFIENEKVEEACELEKQVILVCGNCGSSRVIGSDKQISEDGTCHMMYAYDIRRKTLEGESVDRIHAIVFSQGERIIMQTGNEATCKANKFIDWDTPKPEGVSEKEWDEKRKTVHSEYTINNIRDKDKLHALASYYVGIDWEGTPYKKF